MLVILRPGLETFQPAALMVLAAAFGYAIQIIATKKLTATETHVRDRVLDERDPARAGRGRRRRRCSSARSASDLVPAIIALGTAGLFAHYCLTNAFRAGDASVVIPLDFMRIPLIAVVGWWLYSEPLDIFVFAGAGLIITGILWNLRSETRRPVAVVNTAPAAGNAGSENR